MWKWANVRVVVLALMKIKPDQGGQFLKVSKRLDLIHWPQLFFDV